MEEVSGEQLMLGETAEHLMTINSIENGFLPGSRGAFLGEKRLSEESMRAFTEKYQVEFGQVYTEGSRKKGGGVFYTLYSGTIDRMSVTADLGTYLVNHTHPMGNTLPSIPDIEYLIKMNAKGSLQKSSVILPIGKPSARFNIFSKTIGQ